VIDSWPVVGVDSLTQPESDVVAMAAIRAAAPITNLLDLGAEFGAIFN